MNACGIWFGRIAFAVIGAFSSYALASSPLAPNELWCSTGGNSILVLKPGSDGSVSRIKVACIGDSIVSGYALANPGRDSFPSQLQRLLDEKFPGRYEVRNFGNPGRGVYTDTPAFDKKGKRAYRFYSEHAAALAWQPDIVISDLGINDIEAYAEELKGRREKGRFAREYRTLLAEYAALPSKPRILMWTKLMPLVEGHRLRTSDAPMRMRSDLGSVAHAVGAQEIDMFTPFASKTNGYFHTDGVHPTPLGAAVIAEELRRALLPVVDERR